jgi:hypothetical protein
MADKKKEYTVNEAKREFAWAYHPDRPEWKDAPPEIKQELNEVCAEQNEFLDRHKGQKYVKRDK